MEPCDVDWGERSYRIGLGENRCGHLLYCSGTYCHRRLDIPPSMRTLEAYSASLGHKVQHSFRPNCELWEVGLFLPLPWPGGAPGVWTDTLCAGPG